MIWLALVLFFAAVAVVMAPITLVLCLVLGVRLKSKGETRLRRALFVVGVLFLGPIFILWRLTNG